MNKFSTKLSTIKPGSLFRTSLFRLNGGNSAQASFFTRNVPILSSSIIPLGSIKFGSGLVTKFGPGLATRLKPRLGPNSRPFSNTATIKNTWNNYRKHYGYGNFNKLKGPAIFTILFCAGTTIIIPYLFQYTPLSVLKKNPKALVYGIIALNGIVFLMWKSPAFLKPLTRYGLLVKDNVYSNWSLLGAAFSHQDFMHLFVNMFVLSSFGTTLCTIVGAPMFLTLYLNSAVISSFVSILIPVLARSSLAVGSLGASGAVFSVVGAFSYLIPKAAIALFFIPVPGGAWFAFLGSVAFNVAGLVSRWGAYDYAAHLGGSMAGVFYGWYVSERIKKQRASRVKYY